MNTENGVLCGFFSPCSIGAAASDKSKYTASILLSEPCFMTHAHFRATNNGLVLSPRKLLRLEDWRGERKASVPKGLQNRPFPGVTTAANCLFFLVSHMICPSPAKAAPRRSSRLFFLLHLMPLLPMHIVELGLILHRQAKNDPRRSTC